METEQVKENIIKTAFDIFCNLMYDREYPFTADNLKIFFDSIYLDYNKYFEYEDSSNYIDFQEPTLKYLIESDIIITSIALYNYLKFFIATYQIPI